MIKHREGRSIIKPLRRQVIVLGAGFILLLFSSVLIPSQSSINYNESEKTCFSWNNIFPQSLDGESMLITLLRGGRLYFRFPFILYLIIIPFFITIGIVYLMVNSPIIEHLVNSLSESLFAIPLIIFLSVAAVGYSYSCFEKGRFFLALQKVHLWDTHGPSVVLFLVLGILSIPKLIVRLGDKIHQFHISGSYQGCIALGLSPRAIFFKHILFFNCKWIFISWAVINLTNAIMFEVILWFSGIYEDPNFLPTWGFTLADSADYATKIGWGNFSWITHGPAIISCIWMFIIFIWLNRLSYAADNLANIGPR